jgi:ABC-2 type transport system permease protein
MSVRTVVRDDFTNARRSYSVLGTIAVFTLLVSLVFAGDSTVHEHVYRGYWDVSALVAWFLPLFIAALTYLAIAGDRGRGSIKYALGLPNSRREYFGAKLLSRAGVTVATVLVSMLAGVAVAAATFSVSPDPLRFVAFTAVSVLYALAIAATFVAISAVTASRARAMSGVVGAYFVLVVFFSMPVPILNLSTVIDTVGSTLGVTIGDQTRTLIANLSPVSAYLQATELAYQGVLGEYEVFSVFQGDSDSIVYSPWFGVLVMAAWTVLAPVAGYLQFRGSELG